MSQDKETVYLIDGSSYIYRAYHAIRGLTNFKGFPDKRHSRFHQDGTETPFR